MSIEKIEDYSDKNENPFLIEFLKDSNLLGNIQAMDKQLNEMETALFSMLTVLWLENAVGEQLDVLGIHLDIERDGRSDEDYRKILILKSEINTSSGTPEILIKAVKNIFGITDAVYLPSYPAKVIIVTSFDLLSYDDLEFLLKVVPAGVGLFVGDFLVDELGNFIVDELGNFIIAPTEVI